MASSGESSRRNCSWAACRHWASSASPSVKTITRALPDLGSWAATSWGKVRTEAPFNTVVNSMAFIPSGTTLAHGEIRSNEFSNPSRLSEVFLQREYRHLGSSDCREGDPVLRPESMQPTKQPHIKDQGYRWKQ